MPCFRSGVADPRGCEYRHIKVGVGSCWHGDGGIISTRGWVFPSAAGEAHKFAVCWNGLVFRKHLNRNLSDGSVRLERRGKSGGDVLVLYSERNDPFAPNPPFVSRLASWRNGIKRCQKFAAFLDRLDQRAGI